MAGRRSILDSAWMPHASRGADGRADPPGILAPDLGGVAGVSIIEIIIATLVLSIAVIGFIEFFAYGRVLSDQEEHKRVATLLAQDALERTVHQGYDEIADWNSPRNIASIPYTVAVIVQAETPGANLKTVKTVVTWPIGARDVRSVSLATIVGRQ